MAKYPKIFYIGSQTFDSGATTYLQVINGWQVLSRSSVSSHKWPDFSFSRKAVGSIRRSALSSCPTVLWSSGRYRWWTFFFCLLRIDVYRIAQNSKW